MRVDNIGSEENQPPKKNRITEETTQQTKVSLDHWTHQQRKLTQRKLLSHPSGFYGKFASTLDSESKDPSLLLGRTLVQFFFHYVDYKGQKRLRRKPVIEKKTFRAETTLQRNVTLEH